MATKKKKYPNGNYDYEKFAATMNSLYGGIGNASPIIYKKQTATMEAIYGVKSAWEDPRGLNKNAYSEETLEKGRQTLFKNTGYYCNFNNPKVIENNRKIVYSTECIQKAAITREKTISEFPGGKENFYTNVVKKSQATIDSYPGGREAFYSNRQNLINKYRRYKYENIYFDSSWELAFYIYSMDKGIDIYRCNSEHLSYFFNGKEYYYYPDFLVEGKYVEIKGGHLIDEQGNLISPYKVDELSLGKIKAKSDCIKLNNVKIISNDEIKPMLKYCEDKFSDRYWYRNFLINDKEAK